MHFLPIPRSLWLQLYATTLSVLLLIFMPSFATPSITVATKASHNFVVFTTILHIKFPFCQDNQASLPNEFNQLRYIRSHIMSTPFHGSTDAPFHAFIFLRLLISASSSHDAQVLHKPILPPISPQKVACHATF